MKILWLDPQRPDRRDIAGAVGVLQAARVADGRPGLTPTVSGFVGAMRCGFEGDTALVAVAFGADGDVGRRVCGVLTLTLPDWDNTTLGLAEITVDPRLRRRGIGRALFEAALERIRSAGRQQLILEAPTGSDGERFIVAMGLRVERGDQHRLQDVTALDWPVLDRAYADAVQHAVGYELREIPPEAPDELMGELVAVISAINDAPVDVRHADLDRYSPQRIRAYEAGEQAMGRTGYRLVAVHTLTGRFAGYTAVGVHNEQPWYALQYATTVTREHRGHRLGLLLKIGMLRLLRDREPGLRTVSTWNSPANAHMIAVNDLLGYRLVADWCIAVGQV